MMDDKIEQVILTNYNAQSMCNLYKDDLNSDCCFIFDNDQVYGHTLLLAQCSPVFEAMFFGYLAKSNYIYIKDIYACEFRQFMRYIYLDQIVFVSIENAWLIYYVAHKYLMESLKSDCLCYIVTNLTLETLLLCYEYAIFYNIAELIKKCLRDILVVAKDVLKIHYHMKASTFCTLLDEPSINATESQLIEQAIVWAQVECRIRSLKNTTKSIKHVLKKSGLMSRLRFTTLEKENCIKYYRRRGNFDTLGLVTNSLINSRTKMSYSLMYRFRRTYKICRSMDCNPETVYETFIKSHKHFQIYGVAITPPRHEYESFTQVCVSIFDTNEKLIYTVTSPINCCREYDVPYLVNFDSGILIRPHNTYTISTQFYFDVFNCGRSNFLSYYMDSSIPSLTFSNESFYGLIRGISFYIHF